MKLILRILVLGLLGTLGLIHCGGGGGGKAAVEPATPTPLPTITLFTASPTALPAGASATLAWAVSGATGLSIDHGAPAISGATGSVAVSPATTTLYTLTATNATGTVTATATVTVTAPPSVAVTLTPSATTLQTGHTQSFTALVTGSSNSAVTWSVQEGAGGVVTAAGLYTAPATSGTYHVIATSVADPSKSASAPVTVTSTPPTVAVVINPTAAAVQTGKTQAFTATVTGTTNTAVTWKVQEASGGAVNAAGLYTAPTTAGIYHVIATSVADPSQTASAPVTVTTAPPTVAVVINPTTASVQAGKTQAFTATVTGTSNTGVTWSVQEASGGAVSSSGLYTAPTTAGIYHVIATSVADSTQSATATVTVTSAVAAPVITAFTATPATVTAGTSSSLSWTVTGATSLSIGGLGDVTGKTTATVTPTTTTTYTLTASNGGAATTAEATVVVQSADGKPIIRFFFIKPMAGGFDLVWYVSGADTLSINQGVPAITLASGEVFLSRPATVTTYILTATNAKGASTASATYTPDPAGKPSLEYFVANPATIPSGGASTLAWGFAYNTASLTLDDGTTPVTIGAGQTQVVHPAATTTYTITQVSPGGVVAKTQVTIRVAPANPVSMTYYDPSLLQSPIDEAIAANLKAIAARGAGLRPDAFMRVGDVLTWSLDTLGPFDAASANYGSYMDLLPTAQFFRNAKVPLEGSTNSLTRYSIAAEENATARGTVLGNPSALDAEYQVAMPQYAVVMFGSTEVHWYNSPPYAYATMATNHQIGLMDVVDNLLAKGVIPLLTTMPPRPEDSIQVPYFVALERSIAQSRGIPLIDYNKAMLSIGPDYHWGIGADNLHPTNDTPGDLSAAGLHCGYAMRNLVTLTGLSRVKAVLHDGAAAPDAGAAHLAGAGTPASPYLIPGLPYADTRNTQDSTSKVMDAYAGSTVAVSGKEVVYRLVLSQPTRIRLVLADRGAKILRLFLLDGTCTPAGCLASEGAAGVAADGEILKSLAAGTYHIVVDSKDAGGEYSLMVLDADDIPSAPTNLAKGASTSTSLTLTWTAAASKRAIANYVIYRDDTLPVPVGTVAGTVTSFLNSGLKASTAYNYKVFAVDSAGKASPLASLDNASTSP